MIDGPINGDIFTAYVSKVLAPILAKGDVVILDNLNFHKNKAARAAISTPDLPASLQPRSQSNRANGQRS